MDSSKLIYDWFPMTSKIHGTSDMVDLIGLKDVTWQDLKGAHGYRDRLYYDMVSIHYNGREDMGVWLEMSGQGCRAFETYGNGQYDALIAEWLYNRQQMNITRVDVAFDDFEGYMDIDLLAKETEKQNYVSRCDEWKVIYGSKGTSIEIGSMSSEVFVRIYDKAKERKYTDGRHWIRLELQMRRDRAMSFCKLNMDMGEKFCGVLNTYVRYVTPAEDSHKDRWPTADYWQRMVDYIGKIRLYQKPGAEYNVINLEDFVIHQSGNAIDTYIKLFGREKFLSELRQRGTRPNPKYDLLLQRHGKA